MQQLYQPKERPLEKRHDALGRRRGAPADRACVCAHLSRVARAKMCAAAHSASRRGRWHNGYLKARGEVPRQFFTEAFSGRRTARWPASRMRGGPPPRRRARAVCGRTRTGFPYRPYTCLSSSTPSSSVRGMRICLRGTPSVSIFSQNSAMSARIEAGRADDVLGVKS